MTESRRFSVDVLFNAGGMFVFGLSGLILSVLIAKIYGPEALGVFNQAFAFFLIGANFGVLGIHWSLVKHIAGSNDQGASRIIMASGILLVTAIASVMTLLMVTLAPHIGRLYGSGHLESAILLVTPGLFFFALNKTFFGILNGQRRMKLYAVLQAVRGLLLLGSFATFVTLEMDAKHLPAILSISEFLLFLVLLPPVGRYGWPFPGYGACRAWFQTHLRFGVKSFFSGALAELNTRVDILMLGLFTTDHMVGIYSLAAVLMEGVVQVAHVIRINVNPVLTRKLAEEGTPAVIQMIRSWVPRVYGISLILLAAIWGVAFLGYHLLFGNEIYNASFTILLILFAGFALTSGYFPFNMLLVQGGHPGHYSVMMTAMLMTNVLFNLCLIPWLGIYGAAIATALSFGVSVYYLKTFTYKIYGEAI